MLQPPCLRHVWGAAALGEAEVACGTHLNLRAGARGMGASSFRAFPQGAAEFTRKIYFSKKALLLLIIVRERGNKEMAQITGQRQQRPEGSNTVFLWGGRSTAQPPPHPRPGRHTCPVRDSVQSSRTFLSFVLLVCLHPCAQEWACAGGEGLVLGPLRLSKQEVL